MKKIIIVITGVILLSCTSLFAANIFQEEYSTAAKSGKWVAEYGGGSTPFRCVCTSSTWRAQCVVGDITSNISLCE